ncbi:S8 family serine peptidase [Flavobacterium algicola]|uniref:S8 family serine peptidase n=1 Tax=Flavobacterium algicola TaxID=556529 RepID=UPI001EFED365|nr:S8 family serine peptidase [Flavobacterium algicola]MCG9792683.1 S8 family serine peptidase [Flavobacterium algicola]
MRKKLLSLVLINLSIMGGWSQVSNQDNYSISINGRKINTTADFSAQVSARKKSTDKKIPKTEYSLMQFTKIPTLDEQKELKNKGINLISYLSNNAYYVAIDSKYYNQSTFSKNIRTVVAVDSELKIDPVIVNGAVPEYGMENNNIKVVASYFKGVDEATINSDLAKLNIKSFKNISSYNQVYLEVPSEKVNELAELNWVQNIELQPAPVESDNVPGVTSHKANVLSSKIPGLGYDLSGKGVKIGIWDGNLEKHIDHTGRVTNREYENPSSHGEHVSGTIGGAGVLDPRAKGMAPDVQMFGWNFNTQSNGLPVYVERDLAAADDGVEITSNSYGVSLTTGYNTTRYSVSDRGDDDVTVKYPYLLNVYSNGNSQSAYTGGFNTSTKASKNALHVAANDPNDVISTYSSFGPTLDGRLVPQIAAVGTNVYSLDYSNGYQTMSGTSMATPGTSGTLVLLYERYKNIYAAKPLASLMKALVCNTAKDVGNAGPDYKYGFGNLNALRAIKVLDKKMFYTASVANGATYEKQITVPAGLSSLKIMMAYSDIGATPGATNISVNDLDIKIVKDGVTTLPWILDPTLPNAIAKRGVDLLNNIEQITLDNPAAGTYTIIVTGTTVPLNAQEFSVVYDYVAPELVVTYPIGGEKFNPKSTEYIRWDYEGDEKPFTIEYSVDGGNTYTIIAADLPAAARNFAWTVPQGVVSNAKIRISAGSKVEFSKENFAVMTEPENLQIAPAACGVSAYTMTWNAISGATYEVLKLNGYAFESVAIVSDPTYTFANLTVGDNNWFTVRAIDTATGLVSQRAKAINVEPISSPTLTAPTLPFKENFNDRKPTNYTLSKASSTGTIGYESASLDLLDAVKMSGSSVAGSPLWVASTVSNAFTNNPNYIKRLSFCDIDATTLTGKAIRLKFNLIWSNSVAANKNFFRVLVNGVPVTSHENVSVYGGASLSGNTTLTYDLAAVAGTKFSVTLEGVMDNDATTTPTYNTIFIDNVEIYEATTTDLALSSLTTNTGYTATETVSAKIYNYSPTAISNIPISYKINNQAEVTEVLPGPIAPLSESTYTFTKTADFVAGGIYTVVAKITPTGDTVEANNSITKTVINNGTDIAMGSATTVTTCSAVFVDNGSRYADYGNSLTQTITFAPAVTGNSIKVDFTEFDVEAGYDYLYVYNGSSVSATLLGKFDGNSLPPSLTSTATGGQLTFRFISDSEVVEKGWVATISCVAKPTSTLNDTGITQIYAPEILGKKTAANPITILVKNNGATARTNVSVYYEVNGEAKVTGTIATIASLATATYTFETTADLSLANGQYTIKAGVNEIDDDITNNSIEKVVYNNNNLPTNTNTNGFAITSFKWNDVINNSGVTGYSDFKNIKIPVYSGFTYQPQVTISKPERPISRDLSSTTPGVFTMIVIDLNGDGNLTDEFYAGNFWVNTLTTATSPAVASTTSIHNFRNNTTLVGGLTIPASTTSGEKLMRVIHMFRSPSEYFNVNLGPTFDGLKTSREDFEIEEYTINVLPFTAADASVESITAPVKLGMKPVTVTALIRNYSTTAISNFPIAYKINGGAEVVQTNTASIAAGATGTFTFTTKADLSAVGNYAIEVYTKLVGDTDATNDSKTISFNHVADAATNVVGTFDGVDDYIVTDVSPALDLTNNYTFEAWVNRNNPTTFGRILDKSRVLLFVHTNNNPTYNENSLVLSITTATGSYVANTGANSVSLNKWQHIAFSVSATNVYTIYVNGVAVPFTATGTAAAASTNATLQAFIGNNASLTRGIDGKIDEVRIWSGVRDQATLMANATTKFTGNEAGLLAYYSFSSGDGQYVYDTSASDNTAIVKNADTNGMGIGKFWNTPVLLESLKLTEQLSSSYDAASKTFNVVLKDGIDINAATIDFSAGMNSTVTIGGLPVVSGQTLVNFGAPVVLEVQGVGFNTGIVEQYSINVLVGLNSESKLISYDFKASANPSLTQDIATTISGDNVTATVPFGVTTSNLKAAFTVSTGAELYIDNVKQTSQSSAVDYTNNVLVTVVSENKLSKTNYNVAINAKNPEASFINYSVANQVGSSLIDTNSKTVKVFVNNNANLNALVPVFQVSEQATVLIGTYYQNSGVTSLNYTMPIMYNVIAQNGTIQKWTITIERAVPMITLLGQMEISIGKGCTYMEAGYSAKDNLGTDLTSNVMVTSTLDVNTIGTYVVSYTVKDAFNNEVMICRTVHVTNDGCSLDIKENAIEGFAIFPNPIVNGKVFVITANNGSKKVTFYDVSGKEVLSLQTESKEINTSSLIRGVYILKVEEDGKTSTEKVIVQ